MPRPPPAAVSCWGTSRSAKGVQLAQAVAGRSTRRLDLPTKLQPCIVRAVTYCGTTLRHSRSVSRPSRNLKAAKCAQP